MVSPVLTDGDKLYIAGIFDGEGSAGVYLHKNKYPYTKKDGTTSVIQSWCPQLKLSMCDPEPVRFLALCFPGTLCQWQPKRAGHKLVYQYSASYRQAEAFARKVLPYVKNLHKVKQLTTITNHYGSREV